MNINIKIRILFLSLIFLVGQASAADVVVTPSTKTVIPGQTFNLNISIDPKGTAIAGAQLNIEFNKTLLNVNSIKEGNLFKQNRASTFFNNGTKNNSLGTVLNTFNVILGHFNVSTPETFIIINFTALGSSGQSGINLTNVKISNPSANYVALTVINGSVNINKTGDDTTPDSVNNLRIMSYAPSYINWTWTDPSEVDFARVIVYINGKFKTNVSNGVRYYNATGLIPKTAYTISTHTVDTSGNINKTWKNLTAITAKDAIPPVSITNLKNISYARGYIKWNWTDPSDVDFIRVIVYINGKFKTNVSNGVRYYNATGLIPNTTYTISTHTVDTSGNINKTWKNYTAKTSRK